MFGLNSIKHMGGTGSLMTSEPECLMKRLFLRFYSNKLPENYFTDQTRISSTCYLP